MGVSTNYTLIPYPDHNYQVLPHVQDNGVALRDRDQEFVEPHKMMRRPSSPVGADPIHSDFRVNYYDATRRLQFSDPDQIGYLVDVYA